MTALTPTIIQAISRKAKALRERFHDATDPTEQECVESLTLTAQRMIDDGETEQAILDMIDDTNIAAIIQALMFY